MEHSDPNAVTPKDQFLASLERCASAEGFLSAFYSRFLTKSEEIRAKFRHTNLERQERMLLNSLRLLGAAAAGNPAGLSELRQRAESHDRYHLDIKPDHYEMWRDSLVETASEFDPGWSDSVGEAWNRILGHIISHMVRHY